MSKQSSNTFGVPERTWQISW